jgi:hypothetical protein
VSGKIRKAVLFQKSRLGGAEAGLLLRLPLPHGKGAVRPERQSHWGRDRRHPDHHRDTALCLDENNVPLRDAIVWLDKRKADFNDPYPAWKRALFELIGMGDATKILYQASPGNWIMQHEPDVWAKTAKFVMLPTYLNFKLTGVLADTPANMIGHIPFDYKNRRWMKPGGLTRCFCDVPEEKLCRLIPSGSTVGKITGRSFPPSPGCRRACPLSPPAPTRAARRWAFPC